MGGGVRAGGAWRTGRRALELWGSRAIRPTASKPRDFSLNSGSPALRPRLASAWIAQGVRREARKLSTGASSDSELSFDEAFDYVVVGGGSAGGALTYRLTECGKHKVLLLEFGDNDRSDPRDIFLHMPTALAIPMNMRKYNWWYHAEPDEGVNNRVLHCPRGKVLGGSSNINGMVFVRGHKCDFDHWEQEHGARGWSYKDCLPYFKRMETWAEGANNFRGGNGPVGISNGPFKNPLFQAFVDAGVEAGYGATTDYNGFRQEGFGKMAMTVNNGMRSSTATCYIHPASKRPNLSIKTNALVQRVLFQGKRAVGVEFEKDGKIFKVKADKEVILSAGAIGSPQLLQLSGVGNEVHLNAAGIRPVHHLPGVGENLHDHLELLLQYECTQPVSLYEWLKPWNKLRIGIEWILFQTGLGATNHLEAAGFIRSKAGEEYPDIQYHFMPVAASYDGNSVVSGHGFQAHFGPMRSKSRGYVRIKQPGMQHHPTIKFNYLSHPEDMIEWRRAVRLTREVLGQPALDGFRGREIYPGESVISDQEIDYAVRNKVESAYHPCGTCKMGEGGSMDVVDSQLKVHGLEGVRVVDSSIMPRITNGNLNGPSMMIGEKESGP